MFLKERSIDKIFPPSIGPGPVPYSKQHVYVPKNNPTNTFITSDSWFAPPHPNIENPGPG